MSVTMLHLLVIVHCHKQLISIMFLTLRTAREPASKTFKNLVISRLFRCSAILSQIPMEQF